jgi:serine/threonine protein kinase/formylglycine-generating enzyme required for sulfatase activity
MAEARGSLAEDPSAQGETGPTADRAPMTTNPQQLEELAFRCLERMDAEGETALDALCAEHPTEAAALRQLVAELRRLGLAQPPDAEAGPERIGEYRVLRQLGAGGMGVVYLTWHERLQRPAAVKLLRPGTLPLPRSRARFRREVEALSRLDHPHICTVYEAGEVDGVPFLAMRYLAGETLASRIARAGALRGGAPRPVLRDQVPVVDLLLLEKVARALDAAHEAGVVHRDVKPANIMVDERGEPSILDFGLAHDDQASEGDLTRSAEQLGTPGFMAPEQIAPEVGRVDRRTDVYQLGVTTYQCLTGRMPFEVGTREGVYRAILAGDAPEPHRLDRRIGRELSAVVMRAMHRDPERRFATAAAFADELARIRAHRPTLTRRAGLLHRACQWCLRNPVAAVFLATLSLGLLASLWLSTRLRRQTEAFEMLANVLRLEQAVADERALYPAWPTQAGELEGWLREHGAVLAAELPRLRRTVLELRAAALPQSPAEREAERRAHPRFADWEQLERSLRGLRRAADARAGRIAALPALPAHLAGAEARALDAFAWPLVNPFDTARGRGDEDLALTAVEAALARLEDGDRTIGRGPLLRTRAAALLANGRDAEALRSARDAVELAAPADRERGAALVRAIEDEIAAAGDGRATAALERLEADCAALRAAVDERRTWTFEDDAADYLHATLTKVLAGIEAFEREQHRGVVERLAWARRVDGWTQDDPAARARWDEAREAIAAADGRRASALYGEVPIDLVPQTGLVPIGMNPVTGLWEFYHLRSAWDPATGIEAAAALPIPTHRPDGSIAVEAGTGIVFVLIPGGTFWMGERRPDPPGPPADGAAVPDQDPAALAAGEAPHRVTLAPFFLARHELTRAQWRRLSGRPEPGYYALGETYLDAPLPIGPTHPVESVRAQEADALLERHGLALPTEAQWEYGCRAGTTTPWHSGADPRLLDGCANLFGESPPPAFDPPDLIYDRNDSSYPPEPVGSRQPNAFGLHDAHGNVWEWCRDRLGDYRLPVRPGDGLREVNFDAPRVRRGGSHMDGPDDARSARRSHDAWTAAERTQGLRAARPLTPAVPPPDDPCTWVARTPVESPPPRLWHAMAYDPLRERVVLFGGGETWPEIGPGRLFGDTWEWDGVRWIERRTRPSPPARRKHAMAWDPDRAAVLLFGGQDLEFGEFDDTWAWDGEVWSEVAPDRGGPRGAGALAFDPERRKMLFLNRSELEDALAAPSTWLLGPAGWRSEPDPSIGAVWNSAVGPAAFVGPRGLQLYQTGQRRLWTWDGVRWSPVAGDGSPGPIPLNAAATTCDTKRQKLLLFGGGVWIPVWDGATVAGTWECDGRRWTLHRPAQSPPARYGAALAYDAARDRVVLFGGYRWSGPAIGGGQDFPIREVFDDTWEFVETAPGR